MKVSFVTLSVLLLGLAAASPGPEFSDKEIAQGMFQFHISEHVYDTVVNLRLKPI
jgi:hypothetical protein